MMSFIYALILVLYLFVIRLIVVFRQLRQVAATLELYDEMFVKSTTSDAEKSIIRHVYNYHLTHYEELLRSQTGQLIRFTGLMNI